MKIDGECVARNYLPYGRHRRYALLLPDGTYKLAVESGKGRALLKREITVSGKHWFLAALVRQSGEGGDAPSREFSFKVSRGPIMFCAHPPSD